MCLICLGKISVCECRRIGNIATDDPEIVINVVDIDNRGWTCWMADQRRRSVESRAADHAASAYQPINRTKVSTLAALCARWAHRVRSPSLLPQEVSERVARLAILERTCLTKARSAWYKKYTYNYHRRWSVRPSSLSPDSLTTEWSNEEILLTLDRVKRGMYKMMSHINNTVVDLPPSFRRGRLYSTAAIITGQGYYWTVYRCELDPLTYRETYARHRRAITHYGLDSPGIDQLEVRARQLYGPASWSLTGKYTNGERKQHRPSRYSYILTDDN